MYNVYVYLYIVNCYIMLAAELVIMYLGRSVISKIANDRTKLFLFYITQECAWYGFSLKMVF